MVRRNINVAPRYHEFVIDEVPSNLPTRQAKSSLEKNPA